MRSLSEKEIYDPEYIKPLLCKLEDKYHKTGRPAVEEFKGGIIKKTHNSIYFLHGRYRMFRITRKPWKNYGKYTIYVLTDDEGDHPDIVYIYLRSKGYLKIMNFYEFSKTVEYDRS